MKYLADHYDEFTNKHPTPSIEIPAWARGRAYQEVTTEFESEQVRQETEIKDSLDERDEAGPEDRQPLMEPRR